MGGDFYCRQKEQYGEFTQDWKSCVVVRHGVGMKTY